MTCAEARPLLAAYRRDDHTPEESAALVAHLAACEACRSVEANFRRAGTLVRHMRTEVPPPSFRAAVFAAIAEEQRRLAKYESPAARLARAETDPALPVVRALPVGRQSRHSQRAAGWRGMPHGVPRISGPAVAAVAAVLLLGVFTAHALPSGGFASLGAALGGVFGGRSTPMVEHYPPNARFPLTASALATSGWLVYSAGDRAGQSMLFARDRHSHHESALLSAPASDGVLLRALTDSWAIWSEGRDDASADWALRASRLPDAHGHTSAPLTLARNANIGGDSSPDAPIQLTGVWARGQTVLLTTLTRGGSSELLRFDLSGQTLAARVIARASQSGRLLASPCEANDSYYWSEAWIGQDARLHSAIWQGDDAGHAQPLANNANDDAAFAPQAANNTLLWIEERGGADADGARAGDLGAIARALSTAHGDLEARGLPSGSTWRVTTGAEAASLQAAGPFLLWRTNNGEHSYDLRAHAATGADAELRGATFAGADEAALSWDARSGQIAVLDQ